jgi:hypothetical protein
MRHYAQDSAARKTKSHSHQRIGFDYLRLGCQLNGFAYESIITAQKNKPIPPHDKV